MNADARHGGLRPKRCLPAKFHSNRPPLTYLKTVTAQIPTPIRLKYPQVTADNSHRLKARQLTLFYQLLPHLCR
ncbi:MAG TPA: hypothetical protein VF957_21745, partial [Bradyrhizobium sp.]